MILKVFHLFGKQYSKGTSEIQHPPICHPPIVLPIQVCGATRSCTASDKEEFIRTQFLQWHVQCTCNLIHYIKVQARPSKISSFSYFISNRYRPNLMSEIKYQLVHFTLDWSAKKIFVFVRALDLNIKYVGQSKILGKKNFPIKCILGEIFQPQICVFLHIF